jgi:hypothetical protein
MIFVVVLGLAITLSRTRAIVPVGAAAQKCCKIELALVWVRQQAVRHSVDCVACREHGAIEEDEFGGRDNTRRALEDPRFHCDPPGTQLRLIIRRSAGDNPIEIFLVALSLHQGLPPPSGAARPVRKPWRATVERCNDSF